MPKLDKDARASAWDFCAKRDGKRCKRCKHKATPRSSVVDHVDNNPLNNPKHGRNWQILCHSCNTKKNPRGAGKRGIDARHKMRSLEREGERGRAREANRDADHAPEDARPQADSESMRRNIERKPKFLEWLEGLLMDMQTVAVEDIVNGGAKVAGLSQQTIRRYLDQECSIAGECEYYVLEQGGARHVRFRKGTAHGNMAIAVSNWKGG